MKSRLAIIIAIVPVLLLSACSESKEEEKMQVSSEYSYLKDMEDNNYYVLHSDNSIEPVCMGDASFDNETSQADDKRTIWYRENWDNIPTLGKGDSLIMYSKEELTEEFTFERFEDIGYTVGVRGLNRTKSGRYSVSTKVEDHTTYPEGDTDELLLLNNENVIIDKFAGVDLRAPDVEEGEEEPEELSPLTRCQTIKGLNKNGTYDAEVYDGTTKHEYKWTADVRVLASMEIIESTAFRFTSETIIEVGIPETFNTGYYLINGKGVFRYLKDENDYDDDTDFNVPNITQRSEEKEETAESVKVSGTAGSDGTKLTETMTNVYNDEKKSTFTINEKGSIYVKVYVNTDEDGMHNTDAILESPSGQTFKMIKNNTEFFYQFVAEETGMYTVRVYGLGEKEMAVDVGYVEE